MNRERPVTNRSQKDLLIMIIAELEHICTSLTILVELSGGTIQTEEEDHGHE